MADALDAAGDALVANFPHGLGGGGGADLAEGDDAARETVEEAAGTDEATVPDPIHDGEAREDASPAAQAFRPLTLRGRDYSPDRFKSPEAWEDFCDRYENEIQAAGLRQGDWTRMRQESAELRRQVEASQKQLEAERAQIVEFHRSLSSPNGMNFVLALAQQYGWNGAERIVEQMRHDPVAMLQRQQQEQLQQVNGRIEQMQFETKKREYDSEIASQWSTLSEQYPELKSVPTARNSWLQAQLYYGMSPEDAAARVVQDINSYYNLDTINALPSVRDRLFAAWQKQYLGAKTQQKQQVPATGGTPSQGGTFIKPKRGGKLREGESLDKYFERMEDELKGRPLSG